MCAVNDNDPPPWPHTMNGARRALNTLARVWCTTHVCTLHTYQKSLPFRSPVPRIALTAIQRGSRANKQLSFLFIGIDVFVLHTTHKEKMAHKKDATNEDRKKNHHKNVHTIFARPEFYNFSLYRVVAVVRCCVLLYRPGLGFHFLLVADISLIPLVGCALSRLHNSLRARNG